jgi:hypothetical protein
MEGRTENFTPRELIHLWGTTYPWGSKFPPRGEVKNGPQASVPYRAFRVGVHRSRIFGRPIEEVVGSELVLGQARPKEDFMNQLFVRKSFETNFL